MNQFIPGVALEINRAQLCSNGIAYTTTGWSADQTFNRRINFHSISLRVGAKAAFSPLPPSLSLVSLPTVVRAQSHEAISSLLSLSTLEPRLITKKRAQLSRDNFSPVSSLITDHFLSNAKAEPAHNRLFPLLFSRDPSLTLSFSPSRKRIQKADHLCSGRKEFLLESRLDQQS